MQTPQYGHQRSPLLGMSQSNISPVQAHNLKDDYEEKLRLERQNFDLKLKVFHLEETLKKMQDSEMRQEVHQGMSRSELADLKLQIEEKDIELEQRDLLLLKAKGAIEALKHELDRKKMELEKQADVEDRIKRLKQMNDEIEMDYKNQLVKIEADLSASKQITGYKEQEKSMLEEKVRQLEVSLASLHDQLEKVNAERVRIEDRWMQSQQQIVQLDEDLTQAKAHVDLFKMQLQEEAEDMRQVREQLRDTVQRKKEMEETHRVRLTELNAQYDNQIRTIRTNHEHDLEKLRASQVQMLTDVRENYQVELNKARQQMDRSVQEIKVHENMDVARVREEYQLRYNHMYDNFLHFYFLFFLPILCFNRLNEKSSELKTLHGLMESDRSKYDKISSDLEVCRNDLKERQHTVETLRSELALKNETINQLHAARQDLLEQQRRHVELQEQMRREIMEKTELSIKLSQVNEMLEANQQRVKELEAEIHLSKVEVSRLTYATTELNKQADGVEGLARENEKLRIVNNKLQQDLLEANHRVHSLHKDLQHAEAEGSRMLDDLRAYRQENAALKESAAEQKSTLQTLSSSLQTEKEQRVAAEAALSEQRALHVQYRSEIGDLRQKYSSHEQSALSQHEDMQGKVHRLAQANAMCRKALGEIDEALTVVLEGVSHTLPVHGGSGYSPSKPHTSAVGRDDLSIEDLRHEVAVVIERVSIKVERAYKLRQLLDSHVQRIINRHEAAVQQATERCTLLMHRMDHVQDESGRLRNALTRDREASKHELGELRQLREVLLAEHTRALREQEDKYKSLLVAHEQEKMHSGNMQRAVDRLQDDLKQMQLTVSAQKDELKALDEMERQLATLEERLQSYMHANQTLQQELHNKNQSIRQLEQSSQSVAAQHSEMQASFEKLSIQLENKVEAVRNADERIHRLMSEIELLRSRQIDPELALTLRESQSKLLHASNDIRELEVSLKSLIRKTELMVNKAENLL
ncbi:hypothetical protein EON64_09595, partial [archaeon]